MIFSLNRLFSATAVLLLALVTGLAQKPELVMQTGHSGGVMKVAFSPDGKTLVSCSQDKTIKLWDIATGLVLRTLEGHTEIVEAIAFSPDGKILASGSDDHMIKLWDVTTGFELRSLNAHSRSVSSVTFSPDGKVLASGSEDGTARLWDVDSGAERRTLKELDWVKSVVFSPDGKTLATGGWDKTVRLWSVSTGSELRTFTAAGLVNSIAFSADGKTLAGAVDQIVELWDVYTGDELKELHGHSSSVFSVAFSPDGNTLASGGEDMTVKLWDFSAGKESHTLARHTSSVFSVAFSPDGKTLASGSYDRTIELWDPSTGAPVRTLKGVESVSRIALSPDNKTLAGAQGKAVKIWDLSTNGEIRTLTNPFGEIESVAFSPDGNILASAGMDHTIRLWNVSDGAELRTLKGDSGNIFSIAFSPDGHTLATGGQDKTVRLWDLSTGREWRTLTGHSFYVMSVAFSPNGKTLASGSWDDMIKLWDVSTGAELLSFESPEFVNCVAWASNGQIIASGGLDNAVTLWNASTGAPVRTLKGHSGYVNAIAFGVGDKSLATGSSDNKIKLWDPSTGAEVRTLSGHSSAVTSLGFARNNEYVISGSEDSSIKIWESNSGRELASLIAIDERDWIVVTPDGLFDGSPDAWKRIIWRFNNNTFDHAPVEAFFNEFYYPGLLTDIFAGKRPKAPSDISQKDRRQSQLNLTVEPADPSAQTKVKTTPAPDAPLISAADLQEMWNQIQARAELARTSSDSTWKVSLRTIKVKIGVTNAPAGAQDLRLFRNGSLVKVWHGDVLKGQSSVTLETTIPIVAGENRLTAYAFNHDNIKSSDATLTISGADSLRRRGVAYVISIGVNEYANSQYNLKYAVADAQDFAAELKQQQVKLSNYERVEVISLNDKDATKANILKSLTDLSAKIQPEDALIILFAGHGTAQQNRFYLIPHDLGYTGTRTQLDSAGLQTILAHSISDGELEKAVEGIDAGQLLLVIDACNSGQALEAEEKRRGPMNSKGLAQLAYEKGMYILTAAQSYQAAQEAARLGHGFLTYALVEEGLKTGAADRDPKDGQVLLREWLDFATERVPQMQEENTAEQQQKTQAQQKQGRQLVQTLGAGDIQRPRVFYRREAETTPLVVARP